MSSNDNPSLTDLYNSQIIGTQKVRREGNWTGKPGKGFHDGTVVTTKHGDYLIHNYDVKHGKSPVITPISNMSSKWKSNGDNKMHSNYSVGQAMQREHKHGKWQWNNSCMNTVNRVHNNTDKSGLSSTKDALGWIGQGMAKTVVDTTLPFVELGAKVLTKAISIKDAAKELVGGIELSLKHTGVDLDNLYGFNFDPTNKSLIALCQKNHNTVNPDDMKIALGNDNDDDDEMRDCDLSDDDSILKKMNDRNSRSVMVWQHFCAFLQMFDESGDRDDVSFSLDPARKLEMGELNKNVPMKKVYYPENLRFVFYFLCVVRCYDHETLTYVKYTK